MAVPRVTVTDPQIVAVGRTEQQARDAGIDVRTVRYDFGSTAAGAWPAAASAAPHSW